MIAYLYKLLTSQISFKVKIDALKLGFMIDSISFTNIWNDIMLYLQQNPIEAEPGVLATLQRKEAQEKVLTEKWTEKWRETQQILQEQKALGLRKSGLGVVLDSDMPHLVGIDDNLLSTGVTLYHLKVRA